MKRLALVLAALCVMCLSVTAFAADSPAKKLNLTNKSEVDIYTLYVSPTNAKQWEENLLQQNMLSNGDTVDVMISRTSANAEAWDVKVTDKQGNEMMWMSVPLNKAGQITLLPDGKFMAK